MLRKIIILLSLLLSGSVTANTPPKTVSHVNLKQYMGKWYEIASYPTFFQRGCQCTSANYKLIENKVSILNQCYKKKNYKLSSAKGKAWAVPGSNNSKLKVQFFWPFKGDYWIMYLSPGYKQVIVGSPNRKYLWILSRSRHIKASLYNSLTKIVQKKGFDSSQLVKTKQSCSLNK